MREFDAELYLRLIGERMLTDRDDEYNGTRRPAIAEAALALVAVEAIDGGRAEQVLDDYSFAVMLRSAPDQFLRRYVAGASPPPPDGAAPLRPRPVVPCARTVEHAQDTIEVRYVSLSAESTSVGVIWHPASVGRTPMRAALTDDRGTTEAAHFSGTGSHHGMRGRLITMGPLSPDTSWIDLDGNRLELTEQPSRFEATLEPLAEQDPAHRYLWRRIAEPDQFDGRGIEPAIDALLAAGALSAEDALLDDVRAVHEAMQGRVFTPGAPPPPRRPGMPEPWGSLLARNGQDDGPRGSIVLGAVPPPFDGFSVAVLDLESDENRFRVDVEVTPAAVHMPYDLGMGPQPLAWWARDDRGNHYLGQREQWSHTDHYDHGTVAFHPAIDPRAARLELLPTGPATRAVISFALPWSTT